jgi:N-acetylglutamate synthase-like GNAT family acetyltransferase
MDIRRATTTDAEELTRLAHESKSHWGYPQRWIELWRDQLTIEPATIADNPYYLAEEDGQVLACYGLIAGEAFWTLEDFWVRPSSMGRGVGRAMIEHLKVVAIECGARTVQIDADPNAEQFYLRMGAHKVGEAHSQIDGTPRVRPILHLPLVAMPIE